LQPTKSTTMKKKNNPWSILGIPPDSDLAEVKKAYKTLSQIHHPDKGGKVRDWLDISEAYQTVKSKEYIPIAKTNNTQLLNINLSLKQQILGTENIIVAVDDEDELYINISIPRGAMAGDKFKVTQGDVNYIINIKELAHSDFTRQGTSLIMYKSVSIVDALKRTPLLIEGPAGEFIEVELPAEIKTGTIISVAGHGLHNRKNRERGKLKIHLIIDLPIISDDNIEQFITRLKDD
jgi:DnaJ-class molecular chaperone